VRDRPIFFIHIMKTGGVTFSAAMRSIFEPDAMFPGVEMSHIGRKAYTKLDFLRNISKERTNRTRFFAGHYPFVASTLVDLPVTTVTILRDPVERVISHLRQISRNENGWRKLTALADVTDPPLLDVYQDQFLRSKFFINHQLKMFAFKSADGLQSYLDPLTIDEDSLELAIGQLRMVDLIGFQHSLDDFIRSVGNSLGIQLPDTIQKNVSPKWKPVPSELIDMIREDNKLEIRFYQDALKIADGVI